MKRFAMMTLVLFFVPARAYLLSEPQENVLHVLEPDAGRKFLPDRVPLEAELIPVDITRFTVVQFPDNSRAAIAALVTSGLTPEMRKKYQYVFISETRLRLDRWNIPAGMVGLALEGEGETPTRALIARDFNGAEIDRLVLQLDAAATEGAVSMTPKGPKDFELHIGKYLIKGSQR
jgi:hypothetical protein